MSDTFFTAPILNSPYGYPRHHWELDEAGQPTGRIIASRRRADFIVRIDDGHGSADLLNLVVEIKGRRGEDAKDKASTLRHFWVPAFAHRGEYGRWAAAEFTDAYAIEADVAATIDASVAALVDGAIAGEDPVAEEVAS